MHIPVDTVISEHIIDIKLKTEQNDIIIRAVSSRLINSSFQDICISPNNGVPTPQTNKI